MPPEVGALFAGYILEAEIGRGGMGVVYRARNLITEHDVALKVLAPELAGDMRFRERFKRESRLAARLEHANVIPLYHAGEEEGLLYLVMRYIDGIDLRSLLAESGALAPAHAISVVTQLADALDAAHSAGLIHRDVKPANVLIEGRGDGRAYLTDFGLVKELSSESSLTESGVFMGTYHYAAPEQFDSRAFGRASPRTDVYALACVLYHCLTGAVPYPRDTPGAVVAAHMFQDPPDPRAKQPALPPALTDVVSRGLAKAPSDRYATASELAAAAAAVVNEQAMREAAGRAEAERQAAERAQAERKETEREAVEQADAERLAAMRAWAERAEAERVEAARAAAERAEAKRAEEAKQKAAEREAAEAKRIAAEREAAQDRQRLSADRFAAERADESAGTAGRRRAAPPLASERGRVRGATVKRWSEPLRRSRAVILAVAGVALVALVVVVALSTSGSSSPHPGRRASGASRRGGTIDVSSQVGGSPSELAVGPSGVWVTRDDVVTHIDPRSGKAADAPNLVDGAYSIGIGYGGVWILDVFGKGVSRIDPSTRRVTASRIHVGKDAQQLAVGLGGVWVTNGTRVTRIDPASHRVVGRPTHVPGDASAVATGAGAVWVTLDNSVIRIDPGSGRVLGRPIPVGTAPQAVAVGSGDVWVANSLDNTVTRIDAASDRVIGGPIRVGKDPEGIAVGDGKVWVANTGDNTVTRIDSGSGHVLGSPIRVGHRPKGIAVGQGAVWVANSDDTTVSRIDPSTGTVTGP
jgi:DNA-binding beta-propeller fold protein YncE/tRNA A-37 threonylcarbamoyl transferase component Bud32